MRISRFTGVRTGKGSGLSQSRRSLSTPLSCHCSHYASYYSLGMLMFRVRWSKLFQLSPCLGFRFHTCVKWFEDNGEMYHGTLLHLACGAEDLMLDGNAARPKISIHLGVAVSEASRYPLKDSKGPWVPLGAQVSGSKFAHISLVGPTKVDTVITRQLSQCQSDPKRQGSTS